MTPHYMNWNWKRHKYFKITGISGILEATKHKSYKSAFSNWDVSKVLHIILDKQGIRRLVEPLKFIIVGISAGFS